MIHNYSSRKLPVGFSLLAVLFVHHLSAALPSEWQSCDIGNPGKTGSASEVSGIFTVKGAGDGIGGTKATDRDEFQFCYKQLSGDFEIKAKVTSASGASGAKIGLMLREGLGAGDRFSMIGVWESGSPWHQMRIGITGINSNTGLVGDYEPNEPNLPEWLKIQRMGDQVSLYYSHDGTTWWNRSFRMGHTLNNLSNTVYVGMAVTSRDNSILATATFSEVSVSALSPICKTLVVGNSNYGYDFIPMMADALFVKPDGTLYLNSRSDETKRVGSVWSSDGVLLADCFEAKREGGGKAIAADGNYIYYSHGIGMRRFHLNGYAKDQHDHVKFPNSEITGLYADGNGKIYISDYTNNVVRICDRETMNQLGAINLDRPGNMAADNSGNIWILQNREGTQAAAVRCYRVFDGILAGNIPFSELNEDAFPTGIAVHPTSNRLYICDAGKLSQIHIYSTETVYEGSFGVEYGVLGGNVPGEVAPDKLNVPVGVGFDSSGNMYVAASGDRSQWHGTGTEIRKFDTNGNLVWEKLGLEFVDSGDVDPADDQSIFTKHAHYRMDYSTGDWTYKGMTLNPYRFPDDPRLHLDFSDLSGVYVRIIEGKRFMIAHAMRGNRLIFYRFENGSETAIPCAWIEGSGISWPSSQPSGDWIWIDDNGDGRINDGYHTTSIVGGGNDAWFVDSNGDIWTGAGTTVQRYRFQGLNSHSAPVYTDSAKKSWSISGLSKINDLKRLVYLPESDTMILAGYSSEDNFDSDYYHFGDCGKDLVKIDNWSDSRTVVWEEKSRTFGRSGRHDSFNPVALTAAGDYVFTCTSSGMMVDVREMESGALVDTLLPGPEVSGHVGILDINQGVKAYRRSNGEYIIVCEDDGRAKNYLYRWLPPGEQFSIGMNKQKLEAEDAVISSGTVKTDSAASEGEYVDGGSRFNITWTIAVPKAGIVDTDFRIAVPGSIRSMGVYVNGAKQDVITCSSTAWETFTLSLDLNIGDNTIELRDSESTAEFDVDYILLNLYVELALSTSPM